ncbi:MAG: hypothetical protein ABFD00_00770 [Chloroherpetonaceae bacterium]
MTVWKNNYGMLQYQVLPSKSKTHPYLFVSVIYQNQRVRTLLNLIIDEKCWDSKKQKIKVSATKSAAMNDKLNTIASKLTNFTIAEYH